MIGQTFCIIPRSCKGSVHLTALFSWVAVPLVWCWFLPSDIIARESSHQRPSVHISFPPENSQVRANVPIFGLAYVDDFDSYALEYGEGTNPKEWTVIKRSNLPEREDPWAGGRVKWNPDWGVSEGNLGLWQTGISEYPYSQEPTRDLLGP